MLSERCQRTTDRLGILRYASKSILGCLGIMTTTQESSYKYSMLHSGIHHLRLLDTRKKTIDGVLTILESILESSNDPVVRLLVQFELMTFPTIQHFYLQRAQLMVHHPLHNLRTAYLHDNVVMARIAYTVAVLQRTRAEDQMRFFLKHERDDAIQWLLESAVPPPAGVMP